jgi:hypothetical protein
MRSPVVSRIDQMEGKLDELIRLFRARDGDIANLTAQVEEMAPTVRQVADALTFAKVGKSVFRVLMGIGIVTAPLVYWLSDKWSIIAQLFKRAG